MRSRVEQRALDLLRAGRVLTKYDLAALAHCDQRTAQRVLARIHAGTVGIRIAMWVSIYTQSIPAYAEGRVSDARKPRPQSSAQRARRRRRDVEVQIDEAMKKRATRFLERHTHAG